MNPKKQRQNKRPQSSKTKANNIFKDSKINSSNIRQDNIYLLQKDLTTPNYAGSNFPSLEKNNRSKSVFDESNDYKGDSLNEEYSLNRN